MHEADPILDALLFAAEKHQYQRRNGYAKLPYINHLIRVVHGLRIVGGEGDAILLQAAALHDVVEDTDVTVGELAERFGTEVARIVSELTDDMSLPYSERRRRQVQGAAALSDSAKKIRLVDKAANIKDLLAYPIGWSMARKRRYVETAKVVADLIRGVSKPIEDWFDSVVAEADRAFGSGPTSGGTT